MIRKRVFPDSNYIGIYCNGRTMRVPIDSTKDITELDYPEFYDISIGYKCSGNCPYCYMNCTPESPWVVDALDKIEEFFGSMTMNQRPFQIAAGGGNPNEHPDFPEILEKLYSLGITPNYTTNGMGLTPEVMEATVKYCGGVAVSAHPHLNTVWSNALSKLISSGIKTAVHHIISDEDSVDRAIGMIQCWDYVAYNVLLPLIPQGRASIGIEASDYMFSRLMTLTPEDMSTVAFGAMFYPELCKHKESVPVSLYEPEMMSKYLDLMDMKIYGSSFAVTAKT